jgi:tRNA threonylcarbamoyladenosine biosynthesis protein TsaB
MTKILAIDASSEACSAALLFDNEVIERSDVVPRKHTELILPMIDKVLSEAGLGLNQLDALAFNRGPGSFTGVRISTSVAQGLSYAVDLPVIPVSGLAAVAQGAWRTTRQDNILVLLDARMHEVYWACYQCQQGSMKLIGNEHVSSVENIEKTAADHWLAVGSGVNVYKEEVTAWAGDGKVKFNADTFYPQARDIAELARTEFKAGNLLSAMEAQPIYIRDKVV